jgi:hypothetical protein
MVEAIDWIRSPEWTSFLNAHQQISSDALILKYSGKNPKDRFFAQQVVARRKARNKFPLVFFEEPIIFPSIVSIEQASSHQTATYKRALINGGTTGVDLTGGFGMDTFHLAPGFENYYHIEQNALLASICKHNFEVLGLSQVQVVCTSAEAWLTSFNSVADWIVADPDRRPTGQRVVNLSACTPDVRKLWQQYQDKGRNWLVKTSPMYDLTALFADLPGVRTCHILEMEGDCRELLLELGQEVVAVPEIIAAWYEEGRWESYQLPLPELQKPHLSLPKTFVFEPYPSIMKSGRFDAIATQLGLEKLHPDTHLFTSDTLPTNFPGRTYTIQDVIPIKKGLIPEQLHRIVVRNFPMPAAEIRRKFKVQEGGQTVLFACKLADGQYGGILGTPVLT